MDLILLSNSSEHGESPQGWKWDMNVLPMPTYGDLPGAKYLLLQEELGYTPAICSTPGHRQAVHPAI